MKDRAKDLSFTAMMPYLHGGVSTSFAAASLLPIRVIVSPTAQQVSGAGKAAEKEGRPQATAASGELSDDGLSASRSTAMLRSPYRVRAVALVIPEPRAHSSP